MAGYRKRPRTPDFHHNLAAAVDRVGGTAHVAALMGLNYQTVTNWCSGKAEPGLYDLCALALFVERDVTALLGVARSPTAEAQRLGLAKAFRYKREVDIENAQEEEDGSWDEATTTV